MPPPSPERKEQLAQQQIQASPARPEPQQCRRSSAQAAPASPERKTPTVKNTTATYTEQFLRRRRSEQLMAEATSNGPQSPRPNGSRRRRSSSADSDNAIERPNGPKPSPLDLLEPRENGHQTAAVEADPAVESPSSQRTTDLLVEDAAESGKGIAAGNGASFRNIEKAVAKVTMTKKRKAPCSRSAVALALVAGVVTVSVASGLVVCRLYPSSPAAISIQLTADKAKEVLYSLLVMLQSEMSPFAKGLNERVRVEWLALLSSERLEKAARAAQVLVAEDLELLRGYPVLTHTASIMTTLVQHARGQLQRAVLRLNAVLGMLVRWVHTHLKAAFELMESEPGSIAELVMHVRASLEKALKQGAEMANATLNDVRGWIGSEMGVSDVSLPSEEFVVHLETHQTAIQNIASGLTAQESRALQDVQRFEKRRVAIVSAANSIIADTRVKALESVRDVKMAAVEFIENRIKELTEQCAQSIEQEIEKYERTSREAEEWGDVDMRAEIAADIQAQVEAAISLKRKLLARMEATDEQPIDTPGPESAVEDGLSSEYDNGEQYSKDAKAVEDEPLAEVVESSVMNDRGSVGGVLNSKQSAEVEMSIEDQMTSEGADTPHVEYKSLVDVPDSVYTSEEHVQIATELTELNLLTDQCTDLQVTEAASLSESAVNGDHGVEIVAEFVEESVAAVEVDSTEEGVVARGELKHTAVTEVLLDLEDIVLDLKQTQVDIIKFVDAAEVDSSKQDKLQIEAHLAAPLDEAVTEFVVELEKSATESTERWDVGQLQPDVRTRVGVLPRINVPEEKHTEQAEKANDYTSELKQVDMEHEEELMADDGDVEVRVELHASEVARDVKVAAEEADLVVAELERTITESGNERSYDKIVGEVETQLEDASAQRQEVEDIEAIAATVGEIEGLEAERTVVAKEIQELEQLEHVLLQEEGERVRVEEELRVIAEEEEVWLQSEQHAAEDVVSSDGSAFEDSSTATIDIAKTVDVETDQKSSVEIPAAELPRPTLVQISLLSVAFLALAVLAAYSLARRRKRGLFTRAPRRRRRWQQQADSDAEEVVLLPDDSSDDEAEADTTMVKSSLEVIELMSSVDVTLVSSEGEYGDEEEEDSEGHGDVAEEKKEVTEDGEVAVSNSASTKSKTVLVERSQTTTIYTEDHLATSQSEASVAGAASSATPSISTPPGSDGNRSTASMSTPPRGSPKDTPDTSQRARRRLRRKLRT
ncbi:hypothetical protein PF011_g8293 [Phytophthora fragariae]|uniref:Uncharacterized protein n=2 Tax=Phytophthora fragariae TaxID=53985 RepID=A0A6A3L2R1_9STRA|nr:hypothetical protein PF011_g8293 [Phytophthora fragariae]